jgi:hypothetical protein
MSKLEDWAEEACEQIDAGFFSGDTFDNEEALAEIEDYLGRWTRRAAEIRRDLEEQKLEEQKKTGLTSGR